jgi:hypothetical protein
VRADIRATGDYIEGLSALQGAGAGVERAVNDICVHDQAPAGFAQAISLRAGLTALAMLWSSREKSRAR